MEKTKQNCPICNKEVQVYPRYPKYVCNDCYDLATDKDGIKLSFGNIDIGGGYEAIYKETGVEYKSHTCFKNGIECYADEARFGVIVIETK